METPQISAFVSNVHHLSVLVVAADKRATITVYRQYTKEREIVRGAQNVPMKNVEQLFIDYEVPQGVPISYSCEATLNGETVSSTVVVSGPYDFGRDVLFDLADPKRGMLVYVKQFDQYSYGISRDVQRVWGRPDPVVISGVREMFAAKLSLLTLELDEREMLLDIVRNGSTVAMSVQSPKYGLDGVLYFAIGQVDEKRIQNAVAAETGRTWDMDVQQITPPPADYRYPTYGYTWKTLKDEHVWRDVKDQQWWEVVAL